MDLYKRRVSLVGIAIALLSLASETNAVVYFGQKRFDGKGPDTDFTVPEGVTILDVICIGGGGGGRDNTLYHSHGGNGGNSSFGTYLHAEGGHGAVKNNSGGEGGWGLTANGGNAGESAGCSAGGGAAGETVHGDGRMVPGSSDNPFCGGGGGTGCYSTGYVPQATSGPGGESPVDCHAGKYGGGGGSRYGGRAGGGGGYSRNFISVTPGEKIPVTVGKAGDRYAKYCRPADGVVIVAWGGRIDTTKCFL